MQGKCIVALLDILGARSFDPEVAEKLHDWVVFLKKSLVRHSSEARRESASQVPDMFGDLPEPTCRAFGDTVRFIWNVETVQQALLPAALALSHVFVDAFAAGIPLRGAVSYGDVVYDEDTAVGPAVSDAAQWYEEVDAVAIVFTPRTGLLLDDFERQQPGKQAHLVTKYPFQLKDREKDRTDLELWTIAWPFVAQQRYGPDGTRAGFFVDLNGKFAMPIGTEAKYRHLVNFLNHYMDTYPAPSQAQTDGGNT